VNPEKSEEVTMYSSCAKPIPVDQCHHTVHSFLGACDVVTIASGGKPIDVPSRPFGSGFPLQAVEVSVAFALGMLAGMLLNA
jgi:hypothetical protein